MYTDFERHNVSQEEYFEMDGISNSDVSLFERSPLLYKSKAEGMWNNATSTPMRIGSAFDCLLLEPHLFDERYFVMPSGVQEPTTDLQQLLVEAILLGMEPAEGFAYAGYKRPDPKSWERLKPWAAALTERGSRDAISWKEYQGLKSMLDSTTGNPAASQAINETEHQVVFTATHAASGLRVKGMLDMLGEDYVCDLKTTGEEVYKFPAKLYRYNYDRQIAHYCALAGVDYARFVVVEREGLNECDCFELSHDRLEAGRKKMDAALMDIKRSMADGFKYRGHHYTNNGWRLI